MTRIKHTIPHIKYAAVMLLLRSQSRDTVLSTNVILCLTLRTWRLRYVADAPGCSAHAPTEKIARMPQGRVPGDVTCCFWRKSERRMSAKPVVELLFTTVPMDKYL